MQMIVTHTGAVRCLYDESIDLNQLGRIHISRASHVEATPDGQWTADLIPVGGPQLGPFPLRTAALNAERQWLEYEYFDGADSGNEILSQN